MVESFLEAWLNTRHKVLGRTLHPFCLEDVVNLYAVDSPVVSIFEEDGESDEGDGGNRGLPRIPTVHLEIFAYICSTRPPLDYSSNRTAWRLTNAFRSTEKELVKLTDYLNDFLALPETIPLGDIQSSFEPGCPWPLQMATNLARQAKIPYHCPNCNDERRECVCIWRMPLGKAFWLSAAVMESTGQMKIADDEFEGFYAEILAEKERLAKEQQLLNE